jgi:hypothetical protein
MPDVAAHSVPRLPPPQVSSAVAINGIVGLSTG